MSVLFAPRADLNASATPSPDARSYGEANENRQLYQGESVNNKRLFHCCTVNEYNLKYRCLTGLQKLIQMYIYTHAFNMSAAHWEAAESKQRTL